MSSITEDDTLVATVLWRTLVDEVHGHVWVDDLGGGVKALKTVVSLVPCLRTNSFVSYEKIRVTYLTSVRHFVELSVLLSNLI